MAEEVNLYTSQKGNTGLRILLIVLIVIAVILIFLFIIVPLFFPYKSNNNSKNATNASDNSTGGVGICESDTYNCDDFATQAEAQFIYDKCFDAAGDVHQLDNDGDGIPCESLPL